jgi:hypothetical protein
MFHKVIRKKYSFKKQLTLKKFKSASTVLNWQYVRVEITYFQVSKLAVMKISN